jgi:tagatose-1,6-bisphosphate aldolase
LYKANDTKAGLDLFEKIAAIYQNRLELYGSIEADDLTYYASSILVDVEAYRSLLESLKRHEENQEILEAAQKTFDSASARFEQLRS